MFNVEKKSAFERGFNRIGVVILGFRVHFFFLVYIFVFFDLELIFFFFLVFRGIKNYFIFNLVLILVFLGFFLEWYIKKLFWFFKKIYEFC